MKKSTITIALVAILFTGCATTTPTVSDEEINRISWNSFCEARGYGIQDMTGEAYDEYLDTWCGSTEEEAALAKLGK